MLSRTWPSHFLTTMLVICHQHCSLHHPCLWSFEPRHMLLLSQKLRLARNVSNSNTSSAMPTNVLWCHRFAYGCLQAVPSKQHRNLSHHLRCGFYCSDSGERIGISLVRANAASRTSNKSLSFSRSSSLLAHAHVNRSFSIIFHILHRYASFSTTCLHFTVVSGSSPFVCKCLLKHL